MQGRLKYKQCPICKAGRMVLMFSVNNADFSECDRCRWRSCHGEYQLPEEIALWWKEYDEEHKNDQR